MLSLLYFPSSSERIAKTFSLPRTSAISSGVFKEVLAMHVDSMRRSSATYLFESSWKRKYSDRGVRKILARYTRTAGLNKTISPHRLRHFLLTWLKKQGIDDALIQPYSGQSSRQSLEVYSRLSIEEAQKEYEGVIAILLV